MLAHLTHRASLGKINFYLLHHMCAVVMNGESVTLTIKYMSELVKV